MKTKQATMKAVLVKANENAKNMNGEKELVSRYLVIDKKTERTVIDCRVYMSHSSSASVVYASIWVHGKQGFTSGRGSAGGGGYHKESAAIESAIASAGFELYGAAYAHTSEPIDFKKRAYVGGCGERAQTTALLAVAYAVGCRDAIFVD